VVCKLSGLPMSDHAWTAASLRPMLMHAIAAFGPERCMIGSNFPVDKLFGSLARLFGAYRDIVATLGPDAEGAILHGTATRFYRLADATGVPSASS
jgi:predicted TIM-barrel fold metal-dependent hydrolase